MDPTIKDAVGVTLQPGSPVDGDGTVLDLVDADEHGWKVKVSYPEGIEHWPTRYIGNGVFACDDVRYSG